MFNPAKASNNIKNEFIDYVATSYYFCDENLQQQFVEELRKNISKGPLLEIKDVFETGHSIAELVDQGVLSPLFLNLESEKPQNKLYKRKLPVDRKLYLHQEKEVRSIVSGDNAVISTGTGSGKTNCFLIPVINELLREQEAGTLGPGVRALFVYPMNALANDQMKIQDIRAMSDQELNEKVYELKSNLMALRFQQKSGTLDNGKKITEIRKSIAKVLTVQKERALAETK